MQRIATVKIFVSSKQLSLIYCPIKQQHETKYVKMCQECLICVYWRLDRSTYTEIILVNPWLKPAVFFTYTIMSCVYKVKEDEVGGKCGTNGGEEERV
jgi:hypothetical protein